MKKTAQIISYILITAILIAPIVLNWDNLKIQYASWKSSFSSPASTSQVSTESSSKTSVSNNSNNLSGTSKSSGDGSSSSSNDSQSTSGSSSNGSSSSGGSSSNGSSSSGSSSQSTSGSSSNGFSNPTKSGWARPLPTNCITITSSYGNRILRGKPNFHKGIDFSCVTGTKVYAVDAGKVIRSEKKTTGYGYLVVIEHANGVRTYYAHNSKLLVSVGQTVSKGQNISLSGNTGDSTGPHLHFGVMVNGEFINPETPGYLDTSSFTKRYE